jgi:hypothetical protein
MARQQGLHDGRAGTWTSHDKGSPHALSPTEAAVFTANGREQRVILRGVDQNVQLRVRKFRPVRETLRIAAVQIGKPAMLARLRINPEPLCTR